MPFVFRLIPAAAAAVLLAACGGGGSAEAPPGPPVVAPIPDTVAPTVAITDNVPGATATGPVTFSFAFSEDIGDSFELADIVVSGGAAGALTRIDATRYTLVITPPANSTGVLAISVAAGSFSDLAGNANTAAASAQQAFDTVPVTGDTVLANFDEAVPPVVTEFGGAGYAIEPGPAGGNGNALKITRPGGEVFAGAFVVTAPMPFSATRKTITARVYSPAAGTPMIAKAEFAANEGTGDTSPTTAVVAGWQTLTWIFNNVDLSKSYTRFTILPNLGTVGTGQSYFFDDITLLADGVPAPTNYLALSADSINLVNGSGSNSTTTAYTMAQFESAAGISVSWPLASTTTMQFTLAEVGSYALAAGQKLSAAVSITETAAGGKGEMKGYIENVEVRKTAAGLVISVPATAGSMVYSVASDGKKKAVIDFGNDVAGISNTLKTGSNSILFGEVINFAINQFSNDFTGIYSLRGKYKVSITLTGIPLRRADGTELPAVTVVVPTEIGSSGQVLNSKTVTGTGLVGYITLVD